MKYCPAEAKEEKKRGGGVVVMKKWDSLIDKVDWMKNLEAANRSLRQAEYFFLTFSNTPIKG